MDDQVNITYITLSGFMELHKYRYVCFVIMFTAYVLIIFFNSTIVCLIWIHRNLHEPMYIFIAALLINSVVYSTNIFPKLLIDFLSDKQVITYSLCLVQAFVYYSVAGSEFLLLAAMAYDRYVSICKPLQYPTIMRKTVIIVLLVLAWILPVCQLALEVIFHQNTKLCKFTLTGFFCNSSLYPLQCVNSFSMSIYVLFMLLNTIVFPMLFILFTYTRILIISCTSSKAVKKKATQTCLPHLLVLISFSSFITYDVVRVRLESYFSRTAHLIITLQMTVYHPLFNPIIYGLKMKEIYKQLKSLLLQVRSHSS